MSIIVKKLSNKDYILNKKGYNKPIIFRTTTDYFTFSKYKHIKIYSLLKKPNPKVNHINGLGCYILDIKEDMSKFQFYRETSNKGKLKQVARFENDKTNILYAYFKDNLYEIKIGTNESDYTKEELELLVKEKIYKNNKNFDLIKKQVEAYEKLENQSTIERREPIPESVRFEVWRRDEGKCVMCGSQKNLEFDHIIPISKGGANTARNIQLLCQDCNRHKSDKI